MSYSKQKSTLKISILEKLLPLDRGGKGGGGSEALTIKIIWLIYGLTSGGTHFISTVAVSNSTPVIFLWRRFQSCIWTGRPSRYFGAYNSVFNIIL